MVRVVVDFEKNQLLFGVNGAQPKVAIKRIFPRGTVYPVRVHGTVQLTDITKPCDEPARAEVEVGGFERDAAAGTYTF